MNEAKDIPWKRISVEAAAIVASILLAFGIDAWWDDRQEQIRRAEILTSLEAALTDNLRTIDQNIEILAASHERVQAFVLMTPDEVAQIPVDDQFRTLEALWRPNTLDINNSFIVEVLSANRIESLSEAELQGALARWRAVVDELNEFRSLVFDRMDDVIQVLARHEEVGAGFAQDRQSWTGFSRDAMRRLRGDTDVLSLAATKTFLDRVHIHNLNEIRSATESLLSQIVIASDR